MYNIYRIVLEIILLTTHNCPTRRAKNLHPPMYKTTHGQFSITFWGASLWNENVDLMCHCPSTKNNLNMPYCQK